MQSRLAPFPRFCEYGLEIEGEREVVPGAELTAARNSPVVWTGRLTFAASAVSDSTARTQEPVGADTSRHFAAHAANELVDRQAAGRRLPRELERDEIERFAVRRLDALAALGDALERDLAEAERELELAGLLVVIESGDSIANARALKSRRRTVVPELKSTP